MLPKEPASRVCLLSLERGKTSMGKIADSRRVPGTGGGPDSLRMLLEGSPELGKLLLWEGQKKAL